MKEKILSQLAAECPWRDTLLWYPVTDSTNTLAKELAKQGAVQGTVVLAQKQTAGRGRMGRSFLSQDGQGVYLSVILRPDCLPGELMHLTCAVGVAMADAVEQVCGIRPRLKWINDLVIAGKKLGGILTEMSVVNGRVAYAVVGIGINCLQQTFPPEIAELATSLRAVCGRDISPARLAAAMIHALWQMNQTLLREKRRWMQRYRESCITLGKDVQVLRDGQALPAKALDIDDDGALVVLYGDGRTETVSSGEVSVRGMYGYV